MVALSKQMKCENTFHPEITGQEITEQMRKEFGNSHHEQILNASFRPYSIDL
jgi:hypothetical protein